MQTEELKAHVTGETGLGTRDILDISVMGNYLLDLKTYQTIIHATGQKWLKYLIRIDQIITRKEIIN